MDLSKLSTDDLKALQAGDLSKVSTQGLRYLQIQAAPRQTETYDPTDGMSTFDKAAAGFGKAIVDIGRGAGQMVGLVSRDDVAESRRIDKALMNTTAGKVGNIAGNVTALAPLALVPGANTLLGGAAIGAGTGLLQPSTSTQETILNTGLGAVAGAAVPAIQRGWRTMKAAAEPLSDAGQRTIVGRTLNAAAGKDVNAVAARLSNPVQYVAGSAPTVGQAAENAGISALERAATAGNPAVTNAVTERMAAQNAARVNALADLAGSSGQRDFYAAARDVTADQLYGAARRMGVDPQALTPEALQNIAQFSQRVPDSILASAKELAKINGTPMTDATSVEGLHWIKKAIDGAIASKGEAGLDPIKKRALVGLQQDLLTGMDNLSPAYASARQTYAAMSKPINQMDVAQAIYDKAVNPLTGNLQPNAYARALNDTTAARATGMSGATLENTLEPEQINLLQSILKDVQRSNAAQNAGRGVGSDTVQKLAYTNLLDQAGVPTFIRDMRPAQVLGGIAGRAGDAVYARANRELANKLAEVMLDPKTAAQLMKNATPAEQNAIARLVARGASGLSIAAPSTANAQK